MTVDWPSGSKTFQSILLVFVSKVCLFWDILKIGKDGRTDDMCENNDHLFSRSLVGQKLSYTSSYVSGPTVIGLWKSPWHHSELGQGHFEKTLADGFVGNECWELLHFSISQFLCIGQFHSLIGQCVSLFSFFTMYFWKKNQKNYQCKQFALQVFQTLYDKTMKMSIQRNRET